VAEIAFFLTARAPLGGADLSLGENRIVERDDLALVSIATPLGGEAALAKAMQAGWGLTLPEPTLSTTSGEVRALRTAPDQMLLILPQNTADAERRVQARLEGAGYTTDQTDVWVVLEISGPQTLAALERLCPLDTARMAEGGFARTVMEHMGAMILRLGPKRFLLLSASSSAASFGHAVQTSYRYVLPG
jgi:sarcosine oxidase subunit gamma